jgi:hypothetical protein
VIGHFLLKSGKFAEIQAYFMNKEYNLGVMSHNRRV